MKRYIEWEEFEQTFPIRLNAQQKSAVQSVNGPVLLLAVPGSGKTTVLVTRLGYMIYCKGIDPEKILTVTYTVAATKDMSRRFAGYFGEELADRLEFRTINGLCAKIISYYGRMIGKKPFELVQNEKITAGMLSMIYQQSEHAYATESDLKTVRTLITYIKNMMLTEEEILELDEEADLKISVIYKEYCRQLRAKGLMDYDDQMVYAYTLISAWTRHRIPLKSSMPSLHCWHQDRRIFLWWVMKIRVFMASGRLIRRLCSHLKKIIRMQKSC